MLGQSYQGCNQHHRLSYLNQNNPQITQRMNGRGTRCLAAVVFNSI